MTTSIRTAASEEATSVYPTRGAAITIGVLFILATVSAILGLLFYGPILGADYLVRGAEGKNPGDPGRDHGADPGCHGHRHRHRAVPDLEAVWRAHRTRT